MYKRLLDKVVDFIKSEEGKVGVKTSLSLGLVGGGVLLMQTVFPSTANASLECLTDDDCTGDEGCYFWQDDDYEYHSKCIDA